MPESLLYKVPEACALLQLPRSSLYRLLQEGELTAVHLGRAVRIPRTSIEAFVARLEAREAAE